MVAERLSCALDHRKAVVKEATIKALEERAAKQEESCASEMEGDDAPVSPAASGNEQESGSSTPKSLFSTSGHTKNVEQAFADTESSSSSGDSEVDDGGDGKTPRSPSSLNLMPRPQARATSARRALAQAKVKRAVREARTSGRRGPTFSESGGDGSGYSDSDSAAALGSGDLGSGSGSRGSLRHKATQRRKKGKQGAEGSGSMNGNDSSGLSDEGKVSTGAESSGGGGSAGGLGAGSTSSSSSGRRQRRKSTRGTRTTESKGRGRKKSAAAAVGHKPKAKSKKSEGSKAKKLNTGTLDSDRGGSGLVDSDEDPAANAARGDSIKKAVVQEELDVSGWPTVFYFFHRCFKFLSCRTQEIPRTSYIFRILNQG